MNRTVRENRDALHETLLHLDNISANGEPAQRRTPPPNGIHDAELGGGSSSHRCGRNAAACGQRSRRRRASHRQAATWTPAGIR